METLARRSVHEEVRGFLEGVYTVCASSNPDAVVYSVFDHMEKKLANGEFAYCDHVLWSANLSRMNIDAMLAFLTITSKARFLSNRPSFGEKVTQTLGAQMEPAELRDVLRGLI